MPFTGDSSDSESDGGVEVTTGTNVSAGGLENTTTPIAERYIMSTKNRGINPTIVNQPPTPLLSRKNRPPCTLNQMPDRAAGYFDQPMSAYKTASPALSPKFVPNKLDTSLTTSLSLTSALNNNDDNDTLEQTIPSRDEQKCAVLAHPYCNGFIPSSSYSAKTPTRCVIITSASKKLGNSIPRSIKNLVLY